MEMNNNQTAKEEFINLLRSTERENIDDMINDLEEMGFFTAPASAGHHLNTEGGLVEHSLNTCKAALMVWEGMKTIDNSVEHDVPRESVIIASLLHDVCKSDIYKRSVKKKRTSIGTWEDVEGYKVSYKNFPLGHGEKSLLLVVLSGVPLTDAEMAAIRWHMGAWDLDKSSYEQVRNYDTAHKLYPLVTIVQTGDNLAAGIMERNVAELDD